MGVAASSSLEGTGLEPEGTRGVRLRHCRVLSPWTDEQKVDLSHATTSCERKIRGQDWWASKYGEPETVGGEPVWRVLGYSRALAVFLNESQVFHLSTFA